MTAPTAPRRLWSKGFLALATALLTVASLETARAQEPAPPAEALEEAFPVRKEYSPYACRNYPTRVFWGDTHLRTSVSMDAGAFPTTRKPARSCRPTSATRP